jgi:nucleotide-binding universal stress UspA family protein
MVEIRKIVVGNDGSDHSVRALQTAIAIAKSLGAELEIVHVSHLPVTFYAAAFETPIDLGQQMEALRKEAEARAQQVLDETGVEAKMVTLDGNPADALLEYADRSGADMIVVGSHGAGAVERFLLGSTSDRIVHHARCPVLVVR